MSATTSPIAFVASAPTDDNNVAQVSPLESFDGTVSPTKIGALYRIGLAVVAFAMVLLPMIYIGLILLTSWAVIWHLRNDTWIFEHASGRGAILQLLLYLGPALVGGILVFFMVKPFFARRRRGPDPITLDPAREPLLFGFVNKICALVGAPTPRRIDVDCQVNASASLSRGVFSRDLVLTIGLPLASGLNMRQFAGVLAHEFGHFAQGAGMRLTYVIRNISFWFARVVFERDEWDMKLEQSARGTDWRIGIFLHMARGCVWLTRRILWALMHAGNAISCFMLRQMEYDADSYEAKMAGSDCFASTATQLRVLNAATELAYHDVGQSWANKRLPENLAVLIDHKVTSLPPEIHQKISAANANAKTGWLDTHPCDSDRVSAVTRLAERGVFRREDRATHLFADFEALSRAVTRHQYEKHLELEFTDQNLMSAAEILRESAASAATAAMIRKFYGEVDLSLVPLLMSGELPPLLDVAGAKVQWAQACRTMETQRMEAATVSAECAEEHERLPAFEVAYWLGRAGFRIPAKDFGLPETDSASGQESAARAAKDRLFVTIADRIARLEPFMSALRHRVTLALQLAAQPTQPVAPTGTAQPTSTDAPSLATPSGAASNDAVPKNEEPTPAEWIRLSAAVAASIPAIRELKSKLKAFEVLAQNRGNHSNPEHVTGVMAELAADLQRLVASLQSRLGEFSYPFAHVRGRISVAEFARSDMLAEDDWHRAYLDGAAHVNRLFPLNDRLTGRVLALVDAAERSLEEPISSATSGG